MDVFLITIGAIVGVNVRYFFNTVAQRHTDSALMIGTLLINISGSFLFGLLIGFTAQRSQSPTSHQAKLLLGTGFLGTYTTFSGFSFDVLSLFQAGKWLEATSLMFGSVAGGVVAAGCGYWVGTRLAF